MKHLLRFFTLMLVLFLSISLSAQTVHQVAEGTDGITTALAGAAAGDIIELTTSGGAYIESETITLDFGVTIRAAEGLAEKPVLFTRGFDFFLISGLMGQADNWWFNLEGIMTDGILAEGVDTTWTGGKIINTEDNATYHSVKIENCIFQHMYGQYHGAPWATKMLGGGGATYCDSLIYRDNIVRHWSDKGCDLFLFRGGPGMAGYVLIENSTIWDAGVFVLEITAGENQATTETIVPEVYIHNLTIGGATQPWAGAKIVTENAVVKNILVSNSFLGRKSGGEWTVGGDGTVLSHVLEDSVNGDFRYADPAGTAFIDSTTFLSDVDPIFEDPANGNFNLVEGSPAIGAADDGGNLGDPRWGVVVSVEKAPVAPESFSLGQNYPNPFNPTTTFEFSIVEAGHVTLQVYNVLGQVVSTLVNENMPAGQNTISWNASNQMSGVYLYRLTSGNNSQVRKMILMK